MLTPRFSQLIEAGFPIVFARAPCGFYPALVLQPLESGIERSMIHQQFVIRLHLNGARDALAVLLAEHQRAQNQKVQSSLEERDAVFFISGGHSTQVCYSLG